MFIISQSLKILASTVLCIFFPVFPYLYELSSTVIVTPQSEEYVFDKGNFVNFFFSLTLATACVCFSKAEGVKKVAGNLKSFFVLFGQP